MPDYNDIVSHILEDLEYQYLCEEDENSVPIDAPIPKGFADRMEGARYNLYKNAAFLSNFLRRLRLVVTREHDIKTAAVDNKGNIYINPEFAMSLTFNHFVGVLLHETMHIATLSFERKNARDHTLWNICTDYIMNRDILNGGFELPREGVIDGKPAKFCVPDKEGDKWFVEADVVRRETLPNQINNPLDPNDTTPGSQVGGISIVHVKIDVTRMSAGGLYKELVDAMGGESNIGDAMGDESNSEEVGKNPGKGAGGGESNSGKVGKNPGKGAGLGKSLDKHLNDPKDIKGIGNSDQPGNKSPQDIGRDINTAISSTENQAAGNEAEGEGPGVNTKLGGTKLRDIFSKYHKPIVNWRQVLKNILVRSAREYDMSRPRKKALANGYFAPKSTKVDEIAPVCIVIDTSGSVSNPEINAFLVETIALIRQYPTVKILLLLVNVKVYFAEMLTKSNQTQVMTKVLASKRYNGTFITCAVPWLKEHGFAQKIRAVIYFTDGCIQPTDNQVFPPPMKTFALITTAGGYDSYKKINPTVKSYYVDVVR